MALGDRGGGGEVRKDGGFVFVKMEIALSRQCRDLLTDDSAELIVPSCGVTQNPATSHEGRWILLAARM